MCKQPEKVLEAIRRAEMSAIDAMTALSTVENDEEICCATHAQNLSQIVDKLNRIGGMSDGLADLYKSWRPELREPVEYLEWCEATLTNEALWSGYGDEAEREEAKNNIRSFLVIERAKIAAGN